MIFLRRYLLSLFLLSATLLANGSQDDAIIKTAIENKYLEIYPSLRIQNLQITALGKMPKQFTHYQIEKIYLSKASLKRNRGTFSVLFSNPKKKKKRFYKFTLDAMIGVYLSTYKLKRDQPISTSYVHYQEKVFKNFPSMPIDQSYFDDYATKRTIQKDRVITVNDVKRILDIKRGKLIDATLHDGNVALTFKVKALQEGNIGEIIRVKRGYYKKFNAQITSKTSVDILE